MRSAIASTHVYSLGLTWPRWDSFELTSLHKLGLTCTHLDSIGLTGTQLLHWVSLGLTWPCAEAWLTSCHVESLFIIGLFYNRLVYNICIFGLLSGALNLISLYLFLVCKLSFILFFCVFATVGVFPLCEGSDSDRKR